MVDMIDPRDKLYQPNILIEHTNFSKVANYRATVHPLATPWTFFENPSNCHIQYVVDFVHATARASARFGAPLRLVCSPCVAFNVWTTLRVSCSPRYPYFLFEFSLSLCRVTSCFVLYSNSLYIISVTHVPLQASFSTRTFVYFTPSSFYITLLFTHYVSLSSSLHTPTVLVWHQTRVAQRALAPSVVAYLFHLFLLDVMP